MQYRPAQLRTKNIHGILTMFMFALTQINQYFHTISGIKSPVPRVHLQLQSFICYQMDRITQIAYSSKQPLLQKYGIQSRSVNYLKLGRIYPEMLETHTLTTVTDNSKSSITSNTSKSIQEIGLFTWYVIIIELQGLKQNNTLYNNDLNQVHTQCVNTRFPFFKLVKEFE